MAAFLPCKLVQDHAAFSAKLRPHDGTETDLGVHAA